MINDKKIGMCLSGGGYRAVAYHLGTLKKLHELGILDKVDVISTVSGGAIIGAYYGLHGHDFNAFEKGVQKGLKSNVIIRTLSSIESITAITFFLSLIALSIYVLFTDWAWVSPLIIALVFTILIAFQFWIYPVSRIIERVYDRIFFNNKQLQHLPEKPFVVINSTNLETGRLFSFSQEKMSDSAYKYPKGDKKPIDFLHQTFPISRAVMASSCVPFAFTPVPVAKRFFKDQTDYDHIKPKLIDGGVYDNQGLHKLTHEKSDYKCDIVIVSDVGNLLPSKYIFTNTLTLLIRTCSLFMNRIENFQLSNHLYHSGIRDEPKQIAYIKLGWDFENCVKEFVKHFKEGKVSKSVYGTHGLNEEDMLKNYEYLQKIMEDKIGYQELLATVPDQSEKGTARGVKTNLLSLSDNKIQSLQKHASSLTELQIKLYCPILFESS